ncbi:MAG: phenylalanine--tRNA ligase subunit beta [Thermosulfidibacteraceae bacterium]
MKVLWSLVSNFVDVTDLSPYDVAEKLINAGVEVEDIEDLRERLRGVVSAVINRIELHPYTPSLNILYISDGKDEYRVVCSDQLLKEGDVVLLCRPGSNLPDGTTVSVANVRGVESQGMLLSEIELGTDPNATRVLLLDRTTPIGIDAIELLGYNDYVLLISPTPNRGDLFGIIGVAREISAICGRPMKLPEIGFEEDTLDICEITDVTVLDEELCPRYVAKYIYDLTVRPSPLWLKLKLLHLGMRPISNMVDVTNYVMFEFGQPLHAFDFDKLIGGKIVVRKARNGETIETLDGKVRTLDEDVLVIADLERPVAIAGIMGGANSEVSDSTRKVLLESAYFDSRNIRRSSKRLGLSTEASKRFERGVDIEGLFVAALRAVHLIQKIAGCKVARGSIDKFSIKGTRKIINFDPDMVQNILGCNVSRDDSKRMLVNLGFDVKEDSGGNWYVEVPSWRCLDVTRSIDLVEEVARIWGYQNIPDELPSGSLQGEKPESTYQFQKEVRNLLVSFGLREVITYSFIPLDYGERLKLGVENTVEIMNPLSEDMVVMRPNLIYGLLDTASRNHSNLIFDFAIFEVGRVFGFEKDGRFKESLVCAFLLSGNKDKHWSRPFEPYDFYDAKGIAEAFLDNFKVDTSFKSGSERPYLHPRISCTWFHGDTVIAAVGELHPDVKESFDLKRNVYIGEIFLEPILGLERTYSYKPYSQFPFVTRDLSFIVDESVGYGEIEKFIRSSKARYLYEFRLIDVFKGPQIGDGKVSYTLNFVFSKMEGTLTTEEVDGVFWWLAGEIEKNFNATIRTRR